MLSGRWLLLSLMLAACGGGDHGRGPWLPTGDGGDGDDGAADTVPELDDDGGEVGSLTNADDDHGDDDGSGGSEADSADTAAEAGEEGDGTATGDGGDGGPPPVDCPENCYCEPIDPSADIGDIEQSYAPGNWAQTMFDVLQRRWPAGHDLLWEEQDDPYFGAFADTSSFTGLMDSLMTEVHEGTHGWDYGNATVDDFSYFMRGDLKWYPPKIHAFDRSEIFGMVEGTATDLYKGTYLAGTQGTYGFYELLDEGNCYINGMGAIAVVGEHIPWGISGRDGAVAFMYYLELYLRQARTNHPSIYDQLKGEQDYVDMIRTQWLRLHFLLEYADMYPEIGINDGAIRELMYRPDNQAEIEMFIDHELEASNCLP